LKTNETRFGAHNNLPMPDVREMPRTGSLMTNALPRWRSMGPREMPASDWAKRSKPARDAGVEIWAGQGEVKLKHSKLKG